MLINVKIKYAIFIYQLKTFFYKFIEFLMNLILLIINEQSLTVLFKFLLPMKLVILHVIILSCNYK